ncbi:MAG: methyltransferase domain-containing protein [Verrucomicrobiota bacterium]
MRKEFRLDKKEWLLWLVVRNTMKVKTVGYTNLGGWDDQAEHSANVVVPLMLDLVAPQSVVDIGCGPGGWLEIFQKNGVKDFLGMDGTWVPTDKLKIPREHFVATDLTRPLAAQRRFDLVVSLEVAEHLETQFADTFIDSLVALGDVVLFSAAIPGQRGFQHVNEQFQDYWVEKFRARSFACYDFVRPQIWNNRSVSFYYCQNMLLFVKRGNQVEANLKERQIFPATNMLSVIHPELYWRRLHPLKHILRRVREKLGRS